MTTASPKTTAATCAGQWSSESRDAPSALSPTALLAVWVVAALVGTLLTCLGAPPANGGASVRALHAFFDAGQLIALGGLIALAISVLRRVRDPRRRFFAGAIAWAPAASFFLWEDVHNFADGLLRFGPPIVWRVSLVLCISIALPAGIAIGARLGRRSGRRALAITAGGIVIAITHSRLLPAAYRGFHVVWPATFTAFAASAFGSWPRHAEWSEGGSRRRAWAIGAGVWGAIAVIVPPPRSVLFELLRPRGATLAPFVAEAHARLRSGGSRPEAPEEARAVAEPWTPSAAPIAATGAVRLPNDAIVVLLTIDCLRADVLEAHADHVPNLAALAREGVTFTEARAPATSTIPSLSSLFSGRYRSQLQFSDLDTRHKRFIVPHEDNTPRFPKILVDFGVKTVAVHGAAWMGDGSGIVRGFAEEHTEAPPGGYEKSTATVDTAAERVIALADAHERAFVYLHLFDAHAPYDAAGPHASAFEGYLAEATLADAKLGRFLEKIRGASLGGRLAMFVSADHGEAFGEHLQMKHGTTVYDETLRVPLVARAPGLFPAGRREETPVSLIDLGPTILDLFGVAAPAGQMGQSLAPLLAHTRGAFTRQIPLAADTLTHEALILDGVKVMHHKIYDVYERYDLKADPKEMTNLFADGDAASERDAALLALFFRQARAPK